MKSDMAKQTGSSLNYGLFVMTVTHTLTHVFAQVHTALFPVLKDEFSLSLQQLGLIAAIPPLCQVILSLPAGSLADRIGSRNMILISLSVAALGSLIASQALGPLMLIVAVSLVYSNTTMYHPAAYSFVTRFFKPRARLKALGIHGAGGTFGVAIGPISLSILMGLLAFGWRQAYLFWFFPIVLGIVAVLRIKSGPGDLPVDTIEEGDPPEATTLLTANLALFLTFIGIRTVARSMSDSFMALYMVEDRALSESASSFFIGSNALMGMIAAPLGGFLASRYGEKQWLLAVLALSSTCFGLGFLVPNTAAFIALYLAYGFFSFLGMAANSAIMAKLSPGRQRGLGYALFFLPGSIMAAVAPMIAATLAETFTLTSVFFASTAIFFVALGVLNFGVKVQP